MAGHSAVCRPAPVSVRERGTPTPHGALPGGALGRLRLTLREVATLAIETFRQAADRTLGHKGLPRYVSCRVRVDVTWRKMARTGEDVRVGIRTRQALTPRSRTCPDREVHPRLSFRSSTGKPRRATGRHSSARSPHTRTRGRPTGAPPAGAGSARPTRLEDPAGLAPAGRYPIVWGPPSGAGAGGRMPCPRSRAFQTQMTRTPDCRTAVKQTSAFSIWGETRWRTGTGSSGWRGWGLWGPSARPSRCRTHGRGGDGARVDRPTSLLLRAGALPGCRRAAPLDGALACLALIRGMLRSPSEDPIAATPRP